MLSIGEFSNICKVSTKTLRYYDEIGLLQPKEININSGYRYYAHEQLETMLFINRLKSYNFSLEEIKQVLLSKDIENEYFYLTLLKKKKEILKQIEEYKRIMNQLNQDIITIEEGKSIMSYLEDIEVQFVEVPTMYILSIRKMVHQIDMPEEYRKCFGLLLKRIANEKLTMTAYPMVLFHSAEFTPQGMDIEFALPIKEYVTGSRDFTPGLCLKTIVHGSYTKLSSVYAKQCTWAKQEGYVSSNALYEVYVIDPSQVADEKDLITEVYYPIKKSK